MHIRIPPKKGRMQPLGRTLNHARLGKAVHQAMTCEPGDLPASGRSCLGPGDGHGTVSFRLSDEPVRLWPHGCVVTGALARSEEHTSELQSLMRISYAVFCLKKKNKNTI